MQIGQQIAILLLDFGKASDRVDWVFLEGTLLKLGFPWGCQPCTTNLIVGSYWQEERGEGADSLKIYMNIYDVDSWKKFGQDI